MEPPFTITPRTLQLLLGAIFIAAALSFSRSFLPLLLFFFIVYVAIGPFSVRTKKFLGVLALSLIAAPYFRWAGFQSDALDRADKDVTASSGSHHLCAPLVIQGWTSLSGVKASEPNEARDLLHSGARSLNTRSRSYSR